MTDCNDLMVFFGACNLRIDLVVLVLAFSCLCIVSCAFISSICLANICSASSGCSGCVGWGLCSFVVIALR